MRPATLLLAAVTLAPGVARPHAAHAHAAHAHVAHAQPALLPPDTLRLADLAPLRAPGAGAGDVATPWEHADLDLALDIMLPAGGEASLLLQGRYPIRLRAGAANGASGIDGVPPRLDASRAAGLWQTLRVRFHAPRFDSAGRKIADARFVRVELNGAVIHENVRVPSPARDAAFADERATGPLVLRRRGAVELRRATYARSGGERVRLTGLRYRAWRGDIASLAAATAGAPAGEGVADAITSAVAGATDKFALAYDGTLRVPATGTYAFEVGLDWVDDDPGFKGNVVGGARLAIDGREVVLHEGRLPTAAGRAALTAGDHALSLAYYKMRPWTARADVSLFVQGPGVERQPLHAARTPDLPGAIAVSPDESAVVQRGFVRLGDDKRTHAASVGDPSGVHYSVDLARGALLQAWRGPFADATEMWHDRGNDQVLRPSGSVLALSGAPSLARLADDAAPWPDDVGADFAFRGYALDAAGRPTFAYRLGDVQVEDRIAPDGTRLRRELRLHAPDGTPRLFVRLAAGTDVRRLADGSYLVDDARYYVTPAAGTDVTVRSVAGGQELLAPVRFHGGAASVAYTIAW